MVRWALAGQRPFGRGGGIRAKALALVIDRAPHEPTLADPQMLAERIEALASPHMTSLNAYVEAMRTRRGDVPFFDPFDGGAHARMLLLLETPGRSSAPVRFTSLDNPTGAARNLRRLFACAGIGRKETAIWNAVPWVLQSEGKKLRAPRKSEIENAGDELSTLLRYLPSLNVVVLAGRVAGRMEEVVRSSMPAAHILRCPHPSPTFVNTSPAVVQQLKETFARAASLISGSART